ncbi:MAG: PilZ domain-containing protein [Bdellovibrionaceae bacterium]|nr:PilZ domain-containing protein [Pseudobdellovibrionaceae bacterium]
MKATGQIWVIYDRVTEKQSKPLSTLQTQKVLLSLKIKDLSRYLLWTPGWQQWISLEDFLNSDQDIFVVSPAPKPSKHEEQKSNIEETITQIINTNSEAKDGQGFTEIIEGIPPLKSQDYGYFHDDFRAEYIDLDRQNRPTINLPRTSQPPRERRGSERHELKIEIILVTKSGRAFRTFSRNISLSGTLLEDEIPKQFLNQPFELHIINKFEKDPKKGRVKFQGRVVGDFADPRRLMFVDPDKETIQRLDALLQDYLQATKKLAKIS